MTKRIVMIETSGCREVRHDVTDAVGALYDLCVNGMDYGSGFWTAEDAAPVAAMAELMGYKGGEAIVKYRDYMLHHEQQAAYMQSIGRGSADPANFVSTPRTETRSDGSTAKVYDLTPIPHAHYYSTAGNCLWPHCKAKEDSE